MISDTHIWNAIAVLCDSIYYVLWVCYYMLWFRHYVIICYVPSLYAVGLLLYAVVPSLYAVGLSLYAVFRQYMLWVCYYMLWFRHYMLWVCHYILCSVNERLDELLTKKFDAKARPTEISVNNLIGHWQ